MTEPKIILDQDGIRRALTRIAFEIVEKNKGAEHLLLAGVKTRGIYLAQRIAAKLGWGDRLLSVAQSRGIVSV